MMTDKTCGTCRHALRPVVYCGRADELAYEDDGDTEWGKPKFCGHCGAKVVEQDVSQR